MRFRGTAATGALLAGARQNSAADGSEGFTFAPIIAKSALLTNHDDDGIRRSRRIAGLSQIVLV
jgi:hypothetical protein